MSTDPMKHCSNCDELKPLSEFYRDASKPDGHKSMCKPCHSAYSKQYYAENQERVRAINKSYRSNNREQARQSDKQWYANNRERVKERTRQYYANNREAASAHNKRWRTERRERTPIETRYNEYRYAAKRRKQSFDLSFDEFQEIVTSDCYYCNAEPPVGVDRIDNAMGYETNNVVPCCTACNRMKSSLPLEVFVYQSIMIATHWNTLGKQVWKEDGS